MVRCGEFNKKNSTLKFKKIINLIPKISDFTSEFSETANTIVSRFESRKWLALGEKQNITPEKVREIVEMSC